MLNIPGNELHLDAQTHNLPVSIIALFFSASAAVEWTGHSPDGHSSGQPQAFLRHSQRGRHVPAQHQQVPLCHPLRRRLWGLQLCRVNCER